MQFLNAGDSTSQRGERLPRKKKRTCQHVPPQISVNQSWYMGVHERHSGSSTTVHIDYLPLLSHGKSVRNTGKKNRRTDNFDDGKVRRRGEHRLWQEPKPRLDQVTDPIVNTRALGDEHSIPVERLVESTDFRSFAHEHAFHARHGRRKRLS